MKTIIQNRKKLITIISIASIALMALPIIVASAYTMLVYDDIWHGLSVGAFNVSFFEYFAASIKYSIYAYKTFSGTYFAMFIQALLSPINNGGHLQLRIEMVAVVTAFFASLYFFLSTIFKRINTEKRYCTYFFIAMFFFSITGFYVYDEIFYWFSGAASYTVPIIFALVGASFFIKMNQEFKKRYMIISIICGLLAGGGSLTVVGMFCYIMLLLVLYFLLENKKHLLKNYIVFGLWVLGAIINVVAPGNYKRHDMLDSTGIHLISALKNSFNFIEERFGFFTKETCLVALLLLVIICGIIVAPKIKASKKNIAIVGALSIFLPFVTVFPITLGYSKIRYVSRLVFMADFSTLFCLFTLSFVIGIIIEKFIRNIKREFIIIVLLLSFVCAVMDGFSIKDNKITPVVTDLVGGIYEKHEEEYQAFMSKFENAQKGSDLVLFKDDMPFEMENISNVWLSTDPTNWINENYATYFGLNSVTLINE